MTTDALKTARQQVADLENAMLEDLQAKAELLGLTLSRTDGKEAAPKQRRKRRTRAQIEADNASQQQRE